MFLLASLFLPVVMYGRSGVTDLSSVQKKIGVPKTMARVVDASWDSPETPRISGGLYGPQGTYVLPSTGRMPDLILIQDVHRNPEVQSRIAALVLHGYKHWGVNKVFVEGAVTSLDLSLFHRIPKKVLPALTRRLVYDADLSGPELAAVQILEKEWSNPPLSPFQVHGLEDPELYRQNVLAYQAVVQSRDRALEDIALLHEQRKAVGYPSTGAGEQGLRLLERLLRLKLTPQEYEIFLMYKDIAPSTPNLNKAVRAALRYYHLARLRSGAFIENTFGKVPASKAPRMVVVGGFHTEDMARYLRHEGRSFIILSPVVSPVPQNSLYEQRMQETVLAVTETLSP